MKLRIGSITFLLFLSSVAFPQATSRYLDKPLPQGWEEDTQIFQQVLPVDDQWWKAFQDPVLDSLISVAVKQNYSVLTAIDRINMAKANLRMERGNFFPTIGLNAGWTRQQSSGNTSDLPQSTQHYYDASLNMSWELDLFGSIRNRVKAQKENFAASKEDNDITLCPGSLSIHQPAGVATRIGCSAKELCIPRGGIKNYRSKIQHRTRI